MKNIKKYKKEIIMFGVGLFLLLLVLGPEGIAQDHSVKSIENKKIELEDINNKAELTEQEIEAIKGDIKRNYKEERELNSLANSKKREIDPDGIRFHLPSILIRLEDNADKNKLDIEIEHKNMITKGEDSDEKDKEDEEIIEDEESNDTKDENEPDSNADESESIESAGDENKNIEEDKEVGDQSNENNSNEDSENNEEENEEENEEDDLHVDLPNEIIPQIPGLKTTIIPVKIKGKYSNVRSFIQYVDSLNYINPIYIKLHSSGSVVEGYIHIAAIHK